METFNPKEIKEECLVFCNNCMKTYFEDISDERNNKALTMFFDKKNEEYFKGCPECETDKYLSNEI